MQVIAHNGPNWNPGALAVQACTGQIAVGVRSTVLFYDFVGRFTGEIRAVGRGRVTALTFCSASALTHLLAVGTSDGFVRVFDAQTRSVFRKVREPAQGKRKEGAVFALRFLERYPNVLLVATEPNRIRCWRYERANHMKCVVDMELDIQSFLCMECVPGLPNFVLVGGTAKDDACVGVAMAVDLSAKKMPSVLHRGCLIYDFLITAENGGTAASSILLVVVSARFRCPFLFSSRDGTSWTLLPNGHAHNDGSESVPANVVDRKDLDGERKSHAEHRCSGTWCSQSELLVSDPKGTITHWHIDGSHRLTERSERQSAHIRQVFCMYALGTERSFVSIAMDRTVAAWNLVDIEAVESKILLKWRTVRTSGSVKTLSMYRDAYHKRHDRGIGSSDGSVISFVCSDNTVGCIGFDKSNSFMIGEVLPFGIASGKRKRESISHLSPYLTGKIGSYVDVFETRNLTVFLSSNKRIGIVRLVDERLEFMCSNKLKAQNGPKGSPYITFVCSGDTDAVSISTNGEMHKWALPNSAESWKEFRMTSKLPLLETVTLGFGEITPLASAACMLSVPDRDEFFPLLGYEDGCLALFSPSGNCLIGPVGTGLSRLTCIAYQSEYKVVAVSDGDGSIVTSMLDTSQYGLEFAEGRSSSLDIRRHQSVKEGMRHLTWSFSTPQDGKHKTDTNVHLLGITDKGNTFVWSYQEFGHLDLRAEIKGHIGMVNCCIWESGNSLLSAGEDGTIRKWDLERQPLPRLQ